MGMFGKKKRTQDRSADSAAADVTSADPSPESATSDETPPAPDPVKELARLENLLDRGMLTREEFDQEKRKVVASQSFRRI